MPEATDYADLANAVRTVERKGDLADRQAKAASRQRTIETEIARAAAALPFWEGPVDALVALPAPLPETVDSFDARLAAARIGT